MAQQQIGVGTVANDNTGDPIRDAFIKVNDNFDEAYATGVIDSNLVTPGNEDTPTAVNLNGITVSGDDIDITVKANGTGIIILDSGTTRVVTSLVTPPTNVGVAGDTVGDFRIDAGFIYCCVRDFDGGADCWLSVAIATF